MNKFTLIVFAVSLFMGNSSFSATQSANNDSEFTLNKAAPDAMAKYQLGSLVVGQKKWVLKGTYDFSLQGGAGSTTYNLRNQYANALKLPKGAIIHNCVIDVVTAPTTAGSASITIGTGQSTNDLKVSASTGTFSGLMACVPVGTAATSIKLTADRTPTLSVVGSALTAGKINVLVEYYLSSQ